jgi:hypothetical protein
VFIAPGVGFGQVSCRSGNSSAQTPFEKNNPFVFGATLADGSGTRLDAVQFPTAGGTPIYVFGAFFGTSAWPNVTFGGAAGVVLAVDMQPCGVRGRGRARRACGH